MEERKATTTPRPATLSGRWPRAAVEMLERALARSGGPLVLVKDHDDAARIQRNHCHVVLRRGGEAWSEGDVPEEGLVVDGIELRVELAEASDDGRIEHVSLPTDAAIGYEDDDLEMDNVRPIATPHALRRNGYPLATFLAAAFPHLDAAALGAKAAALAGSGAASNGANDDRLFAIDDIGKIGTPVDRNHPERSNLYDAACGDGALTVAEPGHATWGYLRELSDEERKEYGLPATANALLAWTDGSGDDSASDVQTLTAAEANRIAAESTGSIIDQILERYHQAGGGDDGHPAHALYVLNDRRRRAADEARKRESGRTHQLEKANETMFAHVDTGDDTTSDELVTLRKARNLMIERGYEVARIENVIADVERQTCTGCGGPLDEKGRHGRCPGCEDRTEAAGS